MNAVPSKPKIYHITHVDNLPRIIEDGCLVSDRIMIQRGGPLRPIGMSRIKARRLDLRIDCLGQEKVGNFVPFFFCSRSIMLYVIYRGNLDDLAYKEGQNPIIHLEADLHEAIEWASNSGVPWAFSSANASAAYTPFYSNIRELDQINWEAVNANDWKSQTIKEGKQAEFLVKERFPFHLVAQVGARNTDIQKKAVEALQGSGYGPAVTVRTNWYY